MRRLLRRLRSHRFGAGARRLTVRPHVAWYWRVLGLVAMASVSVAAGMWIYDEGRRFAGYDASQITVELEALRERSARLEAETAKLRTIAATSESSLQIERTTLEKLSQQVKQLEAENGRLREDLAFFDNLSAKARTEDRVAVYRFKVQNDVVPGEFRYWLLVTQGGEKEREFQGRLQFVVTFRQNGKEGMLTLPDDRGDGGTYRIAFKRFYRAEGSFRVDPKAEVVAVQVRVFEQGGSQPKATQSVVF
jgi:hypothetical protein